MPILPAQWFGASYIATAQTSTDKARGWNKRGTQGLQSYMTLFYSENCAGCGGFQPQDRIFNVMFLPSQHRTTYCTYYRVLYSMYILAQAYLWRLLYISFIGGIQSWAVVLYVCMYVCLRCTVILIFENSL